MHLVEECETQLIGYVKHWSSALVRDTEIPGEKEGGVKEQEKHPGTHFIFLHQH